MDELAVQRMAVTVPGVVGVRVLIGTGPES